MTFELLFYITLLFFGVIFCFLKIKKTVYNILTFSLLVSFSMVVRYSGFDIDMNTYAASLEYSSFSIYYIREPVYWITSRYIFYILQSKELVFVFYDSMAFFVLLYVTNKWDLPKYFPYLWICFFSSVMGMQNVYRQFLSSFILLLFLYFLFTDKNRIRKMFLILLSGLTHNVAFLFSPLLFVNTVKKVSFKFLFLSLFSFIALFFFLSTKSNMDTGEISASAYTFAIIAMILFYLILNKFSLTGEFRKYYYIQCYLFLLTQLSIFLMGSGQSKRVGMLCLLILLTLNVITIEKKCKDKKILVRIIFLLVSSSPTLIFSSSLNMLLTSNPTL